MTNKHSDAFKKESHSNYYHKGYSHGHWHQPEWEFEQFQSNFPEAGKKNIKNGCQGTIKGGIIEF